MPKKDKSKKEVHYDTAHHNTTPLHAHGRARGVLASAVPQRLCCGSGLIALCCAALCCALPCRATLCLRPDECMVGWLRGWPVG